MIRIVFLLALSVCQIPEYQAFEFRNLFGSYKKDTPSYSSTNIQTSSLSSNLHNNNDKLENMHLSSVEDESQDLNTSMSEFLDNVTEQQHNITNELLVKVNVSDVILNGSDNHISVPSSKSTSTEKSSSVIETSTGIITESNHVLNKTDDTFFNVTTSTEEPEEVVLKQPQSTFTYVTKTIYQKTVDFMGDPYALSIFVPIGAGVLFALTIILIIATCRCLKKKCRRRKFRKRVLPDSIKNLRPSDQARLLGDCCESSDEF